MLLGNQTEHRPSLVEKQHLGLYLYSIPPIPQLVVPGFAKIKKIIAGWLEEFPSGNYFYRGQRRVYSSNAGAAHRRVPSTLLRILSDNQQDCNMQELEARLLSCELPNFPPHTSFFEVRTEARHLEYPTGCIDFSSNILAALSFACREEDGGKKEKDGELLFLNIDNMPFVPALRQDLLAIPALPQDDTIIVEASHTAHSSYRNNLQSSVLVLPQIGYLNFDKHHTEKVSAEDKELFRDYLKEHSMSQSDLHGIPYVGEGKAGEQLQRRISTNIPRNYKDIKQQLRLRKSLIKCPDPCERGKGYYCRGEYLEALQCFQDADKQSDLSKSSLEFHRFLASTYLHLCQYQNAFRQLEKLSRDHWSDVDYFMAAEAIFYLGYIEEALSYMLEAILKNPHRPIYYRALLSIAVQAGHYHWARYAEAGVLDSSQNTWDSHRLIAEIERRCKKPK